MELIAIKKNDKYYVRHKTDKWCSFGGLVFNEDLLPSFSEYWLVFELLPTQIRKRYQSYKKTIGYTLKEGFAVSELTPLRLPADAFDFEGDSEQRKNCGIFALYEPECEQVPERFEDVQFTIEVIDEDCEPLLNPKYPFVTDFPYFIDNHEAVRHKYPCHIEAQTLFDIIKKFVKENLPETCKITSDYNFHFCVELIVPLLHEETYQKNVSRMNARKQTYQTTPLRSIQYKIIDIGTPSEKYGKEKIQAISGRDYADLYCKIEEVLEGYKERLDQKLSVCPHCEGYGWLRNAIISTEVKK
jgi:hypothetical protein